MEKSYTCTERLDWTAQLTHKLKEINQSSNALGSFGARIGGFVTIPFVSFAEAVAHTGLAAGKAVTGLAVSPYNCFADRCCPTRAVRQELEFSSALVHLIAAIESLVTAALLPFVCLLNPSRADAWMNSRTAKPQEEVGESESESVESESESESDVETDEEVAQLRLEKQGLNEELEKLRVKAKKIIGEKKEEINEKLQLLGVVENNLRKSQENEQKLNQNNADLLSRIKALETQLKEAAAQSNPIGDSSSPANGEMMKKSLAKPRERGGPAPSLNGKNQNTQAQPRTEKSAPPKPKPPISSGGSGMALSADQLGQVKLRSAADRAQSSPNITNSPPSTGLNKSVNQLSSSQLNESTLLSNGFEEMQKFNNLSKSTLGEEVFTEFKHTCIDLYNNIKELERGEFLEQHQSLLDDVSECKNLLVQQNSIETLITRMKRWVDIFEDKNNWPEATLNLWDLTGSMISSGFDDALNNLVPDQLQKLINYFTDYKNALLKMKGASQEQIQENQKQKNEYNETIRNEQLAQLETRKQDLLASLQFTFELSEVSNNIWSTCSFENKKKGFSNRDDFLASRDKIIESINTLSLETQLDDKEYQFVKSITTYLNDKLAKAERKSSVLQNSAQNI